MGKLFVILQETEKKYIPKRGKLKGIEQTKKVYLVATAEPNNYLLSEYVDADESDYDEFVGNKYYEKIGQSKYYGSPEHLIDSFIKLSDSEPSEDILNVKQWANRLYSQHLTKSQMLETWLPILNIKPEVQKKPLDY